mgnify:CR=1 FL=1
MKLELKKFDPNKIKNDSVVVFIGKRNTGKSYCMKDILSYNRDIPVGVVVSPTEKANGYFEKFIPKMLIYDELDEKLVKFKSELIKDQKKRLEDKSINCEIIDISKIKNIQLLMLLMEPL